MWCIFFWNQNFLGDGECGAIVPLSKMTKECMGEQELDGARGARTVVGSYKKDVCINNAVLLPNIDIFMGRVVSRSEWDRGMYWFYVYLPYFFVNGYKIGLRGLLGTLL